MTSATPTDGRPPDGALRVSIIAAVAANGVMGAGNKLPWRLPEDMALFKRMTEGHTVIMGRKTFESIGRALPRRRNLVVTGNAQWSAVGAEAVPSLDAALARCKPGTEAFVIGGERLFREALERADRLHLTLIHRDYEGDAYFPEVPARLHEVSRTPGHAAHDDKLTFDFITYERDYPSP
jgi:dihydrofolate reductase